MYKATIVVPDAKGIVTKAFSPEERAIKAEAQFTLARNKGAAVFSITAANATGLRIAFNSITKMLTVIENMQQVSDGKKHS